ncbi:MAG: helix-turn-helix domain-containing protein, partial [Nocardioidaceae bacterium]
DALEVRRNAGVFGLATTTAAVMAVAYGWRAVSSGSTALWALVVLLGAVCLFYAAAWYDARSPLLVADTLGVRLRDGRDWHGLPWEDVADVVVHPRKGLFGDGEIEVVAHRGTGYVVPIGLATVCSSPDVAAAVGALASGDTAVTVVDTPEKDDTPETGGTDDTDDTDDADETVAEATRDAAEEAAPAEPDDPAPAPRPHGSPVALVASAGRAIRANVSRTRPASVGTAALKADPDHDSDPGREHGRGWDRALLPEARELRGTRGRVDLVFEPLPTPVDEEIAADAAPIEEWPAEAAENPVVGPQLAAVRERSGITVDALADRTRIRPHVIEAIEVDDFAPCGGDFYARGHIRSLARVLGLDADALVATYDERYAQAPVNARRVFEAELATGPRPSIRLAKGGPNWAALLGVVMVLAIIWGIGQFFTGGEDAAQTPVTSTVQQPAQDPGSLAALGAPTSNDVVLHGVGQDSKVVVRDHTGKVRWKGMMTDGETRRLTVPGHATIVSEHGDAVRLRVNGNKKGTVGDTDDRAKTVRGKR